MKKYIRKFEISFAQAVLTQKYVRTKFVEANFIKKNKLTNFVETVFRHMSWHIVQKQYQ